MLTTLHPQTALSSAFRSLLGLLIVGATASCGGGSPTSTASAPPGSGGTGSFTIGSITGFGSIIVNGVRYDDTSANVTHLDGSTNSGFRLGMVVEIEGEPSAPTGSTTGVSHVAKANRIRIGSVLVGPIGSVNAVAGTFTVLGQTVLSSIDTFFDDSNSARLAGLKTAACLYVKVYGFPRSAAQTSDYTATRVECLSARPTTYQLVGKVTATQASTGNLPGSLTIGGVSYELASGLSPVEVGKIVLASMPSSTTNTSWTITSLTPNDRPAPATSEAHLEGLIADYSASDQTFSINGVTVQLSSSTRFEGTTPGELSNDMSVSVEGAVVNGVLQATALESEAAYQTPDDDDAHENIGARDIELHGTSQDVVLLNGSAYACLFRGVRVSYSQSLLQSGMTSDKLVNARGDIEIHGVRAPDGVGIIASTIDLGDD